MDEALPDQPRKGRGAVSNPDNRYEATSRARIDDGWASVDPEEDPAPETVVLADSSRTVLARNDSPDIPFDRSVNPYRGCEHGCVYCYARPTHAYLGFSPGLDFETRIMAKHDAAELLERELAKPSYSPQVIAMGTNTDPYQPVERRLGITRMVLEVLWRARNPVSIVTKSRLVLRDLDILAPMAAEGLAQVCISVTTLDRGLARIMEPRAATPARRLEAIRALSHAGVPTGVMAAPMIPALNDDELEAILEAGSDAGAKLASYILLRLPLELKELFEEWLGAHFPDRKDRVLNRLREARGGKLYQAQWGSRMRGHGAYADLLSRRFDLAVKRLDLNRHEASHNTGAFRRPKVQGPQLSLF